MVRYKVEIARSAEKALFKLPKNVIPKIVGAIQGMEINPRPAGCRKLTGQFNVYRIRVGTYRIIYEIVEKLVIIKVLKIGHRKDVYR